MSAPPDNRTGNVKMSAPNHQEPPHHSEQQSSNVRVIPIQVEGRDTPVINKNVDHGTHFGETKFAHSPPQQHINRDQYFNVDEPHYHVPHHFAKSFGGPPGFRQGTQPFTQKVYPQNAAFNRGASPQRSHSPKPQSPQQHEVPVHHEPPKQPAQKQPQQQKQAPPPEHEQPPPPQPKPQPTANDPITQILAVQTDVLNLMTEVEKFTGSKKDKNYIYLDEMLTRNLIKLDTIETDGKENIRTARKEAIRCIQKCIAVLEAKAEKGSAAAVDQDAEMNSQEQTAQPAPENGEVEMKEPQEEAKETEQVAPAEDKKEETPQKPQTADTRPEAKATETTEAKQNEEKVDKPAVSEKVTKTEKKKRDKSKDKKDVKDSNKDEKVEKDVKTESVQDMNTESMQVDNKGDKTESMDVDGAASQ